MEKCIKKKKNILRNAYKIKSRKEITLTLRYGKKQQCGILTIYQREKKNNRTRYAIVVPSCVGSSVKRSRIKRNVRERIRTLGMIVKDGDFIVKIHPHKNIKEIDEAIKKWCESLKK